MSLTTDFGQYEVLGQGSRTVLRSGDNLLGLSGGTLMPVGISSLSQFSSVLHITIAEGSLHFVAFRGEFSLNGETTSEAWLKDRDVLAFDGLDFTVRFKLKPNQTEQILNAWLVSRNLRGTVDMVGVLRRHAASVDISDRRALASIVALLDLPEIDAV